MELDKACEILHNAYELAAIEQGWQTQESTRVSWLDLPEANKSTMRIAVKTLREQIAREILSKCLENRHQGNDDGMGALTSDPSVIYYPETFRVCAKCEVAASIARGEK